MAKLIDEIRNVPSEDLIYVLIKKITELEEELAAVKEHVGLS